MVMNIENPKKKRKPLPKMKGQIGDSKVKVIEKHYEWGLYVYKKSNGKWFTDGNGSVLNIPSDKNDISRMAELKKTAMHYGDAGDGTCVFVPGLTRVSEEEYSEQVDRLNAGLIPSLNDLGAVQAAKDTIAKYGDED